MRNSIETALTQEYDHAASGAGDCEGATLDTTPPLLPPLSDTIAPRPSQSPSTHKNPSGSKAFQRKGGAKKDADKARRQIKRAAVKLTQPGRPRPSLSKKHPKPGAIPVYFNANSLPAAKGAFVSLRQKTSSGKECTLQELVDEGLKVVEWDGW